MEEVNLAIRSTKKSKAFGPDNKAPIMLKHLEPISIAYITRLKNLSMSIFSIPSLWKIGRIIPIIKPNKRPDQSTSYRPISLQSPLAKLMEKLLLATLTEHLQLAEHSMVS